MKIIPYSEKLRNFNIDNPEPQDGAPQDEMCIALAKLAREKDYEKEFHGTTIGLVIAQTDATTSTIIEKSDVFKDVPDDDVLDLLHYGENYGIYPRYTNVFNRTTNTLDTILLYMILFRPKELSLDKPTVTDNLVENVMNARFTVEIEIGLVESDGLFRYFVYRANSRNVSPFELVKDLFEDTLWEYTEDDISPEEHDRIFPYDSDIFYPGMDDENTQGTCVTYYTQFGESYKIAYRNPETLLNHIHSIRVIKCETHIIDD